MWNSVKSVYGWLIRRPAYMLLAASDERLAREPPARFRHAWLELMLISLAWGLASVGIWSAAWGLFRDVGTFMLIMPPVAMLSVFVLWPFRKAVISLAEILGGDDATGRSMAAALLVVILAFCLIRMKAGPFYYDRWMWPERELFRVLLLMPLWGGWSMLVVGQFCSLGERTEPAAAAFVRGCGPLASTACMGLVLAASTLYFTFLPWTQLSISGSAVVAGVVGGIVLCRGCGGLTRKALLANNVLTQMVFLLAYLANGG